MSQSSLINSINYWKNFLESYKPDSQLFDDFFALETCKLALQAVEYGNFGVGSIIINSQGEILFMFRLCRVVLVREMI